MIVCIRGGSLILTASTSWRSNCFQAPQEYFEEGPLLRLPSQSSCLLRPAADRCCCCCCCCCSPSTGWARTSAQTWSGMQRRTSVADQTMASLLRILTRISAVVPVRTSAWNGVGEEEEVGSGGWCSCRRRKMCSALEVLEERRPGWRGSPRRRVPRSGEG